MDVNVLIICITVIVVAALAAGSVAYVAERNHKRWEVVAVFAAVLADALAPSAFGEVSGDE